MGSTSRVLSALAKHGLLLKQDKRLPNVVTILTGEALATSWWSHPKGRLIFRVLSELADHPDVLFTKLLYGKDTLVHRSLWPALITVARAAEPWQVRGLSRSARALFASTHKSSGAVRSSGAAVKELVSKLLVHATEVHTESGRHEMMVQSWPAWAAELQVKPVRTAAHARKVLEAACLALGAPLSALPWSSGAAKRRGARAT